MKVSPDRGAERHVPGPRKRRPLLISVLISLLLSTLAAPSLYAREESTFREPSLESSAPFSLNSYDAVHALYLLRRTLFLRRRVAEGEFETIRVRRVRAVRLPDAENPVTPFEKKRYDIRLNGELLDWERTYIAWGGRMVNLRLLYTYRNGALPEGLDFELRE